VADRALGGERTAAEALHHSARLGDRTFAKPLAAAVARVDGRFTGHARVSAQATWVTSGR